MPPQHQPLASIGNACSLGCSVVFLLNCLILGATILMVLPDTSDPTKESFEARLAKVGAPAQVQEPQSKGDKMLKAEWVDAYWDSLVLAAAHAGALDCARHNLLTDTQFVDLGYDVVVHVRTKGDYDRLASSLSAARTRANSKLAAIGQRMSARDLTHSLEELLAMHPKCPDRYKAGREHHYFGGYFVVKKAK